jgi:hypothetical protein
MNNWKALFFNFRGVSMALPMRRIAVIVGILGIIAFGDGCTQKRSSAPTESEFQIKYRAFVANPSFDTWFACVGAAEKENGSVEARIIVHVKKYGELSARRDIPNSLARTEPRDYSDMDQARVSAENEFRLLQMEDLGTMLGLLDIFARQTSEDDLAGTAGELMCRLSPEHFKQIREELID